MIHPISLINSNFNDFSSKGKTDEAWMRNLVPFAVVGSNSIIEVFAMMMRLRMRMMKMTITIIFIVHNIQDENGRKSRGRSYPWGTVNIEERQHCDFQVLNNYTHHNNSILL